MVHVLQAEFSTEVCVRSANLLYSFTWPPQIQGSLDYKHHGNPSHKSKGEPAVSWTEGRSSLVTVLLSLHFKTQGFAAT